MCAYNEVPVEVTVDKQWGNLGRESSNKNYRVDEKSSTGTLQELLEEQLVMGLLAASCLSPSARGWPVQSPRSWLLPEQRLWETRLPSTGWAVPASCLQLRFVGPPGILPGITLKHEEKKAHLQVFFCQKIFQQSPFSSAAYS